MTSSKSETKLEMAGPEVEKGTALITPTSLYSQLHNDFLFPLDIDGKRYKSVTHYIYTSLMPDKPMAVSMGYQLDGATARKKGTGYLFGRKVKAERRLAEASEFIIMKRLEEGYRALFANPFYRTKLLGTGTEPIIYQRKTHTFLAGDVTVLGLNQNNNGQNKLGLLLTRLRGEFRLTTKVGIADSTVHEIDRLFFANLRKELLLNFLKKGIFPSDYTLMGLYVATRGLVAPPAGGQKTNAHLEFQARVQQMFLEDYPGDMRVKLWDLYRRGKEKKVTVIDPEVQKEFETGDTNWIEETYHRFIKKRAVLIAYLTFLKVPYEALKLSLAKQKVIDAYMGRRFEFIKDVATQLSMEQYLRKYNVTPDVLDRIGAEALSDVQEIIYTRYSRGDFIHIPDFETNVADHYAVQIGLILGNIAFTKFIPRIEEPSVEYLKLVTLEKPPEPSSPRETYGGTLIEDYYSPSLPEGMCGEDLNGVCPLGPARGDDGGDDVGDLDVFGDDDKDREEESDDRGDDGGAVESGDDRDEYDDSGADNFRLFERDIDIGDEKEIAGDDGGEYQDEGLENDGGGVYPEEQDEGDTFMGDDQDVERVIEKGKSDKGAGDKEPRPQSFKMPYNPIIFSNEKDYPYEWFSPYFISGVYLQGIYYPSIAHYVAAHLATPIQYHNVNPRLWIQKDSGYDFQPVGNVDRLKSPDDFHSMKDILKTLPKRIQEVYNLLYLRYADRAISFKMRTYPFRQILFTTRPGKIVYKDEYDQKAVAGAQIAQLLTKIRNSIQDVVILTPVPNPEYDKKINPTLFAFIEERMRELIRGIIMFAAYQLEPHQGYISALIPTVSFNDARFVLQQLYLSCRDIDYNEKISDPPDTFIAEFEQTFKNMASRWLPNREIFDTRNPDVRDMIRLKVEGKSEDPMDNVIFVNFEEIILTVWTHIVLLTRFVLEPLVEASSEAEYTPAQLKARIKDLRANVFNAKLGTRSEVAVNAVVNVLAILHLYYPLEPELTDADIRFVRDFLMPLDADRRDKRDTFPESERYNEYPQFVEKVTRVYAGREQPVKLMKQLASVIDEFTGYPHSDTVGFNKLTIRLKLFASRE